MTNSKGSVVVGDEGAQQGLSGALVVPDGGGEGEQALGDAHDDAGGGATTVAFEIELALEGVVDRLDELAQRFEEGSTGTWLLGGSCRSQKGGAMVGEETLELGAGVALVGQDGLAGPGGEQVGVGLEQVTGDLALVDLGVRQRERDRQPGGGAGPRSSGSGWRSIRSQPIRPARSAWRWDGIGRTRRGWNRSPRCRRPTGRCRWP